MSEFVFNVTEAEANLILSALVKLPYEASAGIVAKLQAQANKQIEAAKMDAPHIDVVGSSIKETLSKKK